MMNLNEYNFNFGVYFTDGDNVHISIPVEVGRVISEQYEGDDPIPGT